jgi:hypothetical protein
MLKEKTHPEKASRKDKTIYRSIIFVTANSIQK